MQGFIEAVGSAAVAAIAIGAKAIEEVYHILNGRGQ